MSDTTETVQQPAPARPGPDSAESHVQRLEFIEQREMGSAGAQAAKLGPSLVDSFATVRSNMHRAATMSGMARAELDRLAADNMSNPEGIRARQAEIREKAPREVQAVYEAALTGVDVIANQLVLGSLPKISDQDRGFAIQELEMLTTGLTGAGLITKLQQIASGPDRRLAAIVLGSFGRAKLGGDVELHHALQLGGVEGARKYGTTEERAHAEALGPLTVGLRKAISVSRARARHRLGVDF